VKVLTNIRFYSVAGIAQYLGHLIRFNESEAKAARIYGVDILHPDIPGSAPSQHLLSMERFRFILKEVTYPNVADLVKSCSSIDEVREAYEPLIRAYEEALAEIAPDIVVVSGTYFMPWCLLQAARRYGRAKIIVHYHGVMREEVAHWKEADARARFLEMEREFDAPGITYVFPSALARHTVEASVFGHPIEDAHIIPNPVPDYFFEADALAVERKRDHVGVVSRWTNIKGVDFLIAVARRAKKIGRHTFNMVSNLAPDSESAKEFSDIIRFMPSTENEALPGFYREQGVVLMPSRFETYGNVAQEAIASGTPALVPVKSGIAETFAKIGLGHWTDDFSCEKRTHDRLAEVAREEVPERARMALREEYSAHAVFGRYLRLLSSLT
jgi:glycosyltransferase involved in cell wall biosynthesis